MEGNRTVRQNDPGGHFLKTIPGVISRSSEAVFREMTPGIVLPENDPRDRSSGYRILYTAVGSVPGSRKKRRPPTRETGLARTSSSAPATPAAISGGPNT